MPDAGPIEPKADACSSNKTLGTHLALLDACGACDVPAIRCLLDAGADPNAAGPEGVTPLLACFFDVLEQVQPGQRICATPAGRQYVAGARLVESCTASQLQAVEQLLQHGADPCLPAYGGYTPLMTAAASSIELFMVLLEAAGGAGSLEDEHWQKVARAACMRESPVAVKLLLDRTQVPDLQVVLLAAIKVSLPSHSAESCSYRHCPSVTCNLTACFQAAARTCQFTHTRLMACCAAVHACGLQLTELVGVYVLQPYYLHAC
jgi:hypothetical protein